MPKLLLVGLVERACVKTVIREIPGITDCFKSKDNNVDEITYRVCFVSSWSRLELTIIKLTTNGSNIPGIWHFSCSGADSLIDENSIYSNDIWALLCTYGVEAARAAILREVGGVFDVYKIDVDSRHLELIADYMVSGVFDKFSRMIVHCPCADVRWRL